MSRADVSGSALPQRTLRDHSPVLTERGAEGLGAEHLSACKLVFFPPNSSRCLLWACCITSPVGNWVVCLLPQIMLSGNPPCP